ncbi:hypothetical protein BACCOP_01136 [Phocaeicola coprocola DSM 17136]|uniref:Uncharacterized protein n=1 Tax=Phocaeicola coprocola DSM 17136 TaxID=470145 RepID=B3JGY0_9BACT|nr:hypothetical protein BACCOP_01136 [Phocaeicola coprocola DSM 17136]
MRSKNFGLKRCAAVCRLFFFNPVKHTNKKSKRHMRRFRKK